MSIRIITKAGEVVAYQAIAGVGGKGLSAYITATTPDAWAAAQQWSLDLVAIHAATRPRLERDPLTGLSLTLRRSREDSPPVLYAEAMWRKNGRPVHRSYSTERNGRLDAIVMAMREMERGTGQKINTTPHHVLAELLTRFHRRHETTNPIHQRQSTPAVNSIFAMAALAANF